MPSLKIIKSRITSIEKIKKIANAMEIVALTRMRRVQQKTQNARGYFDMIRNLINDVAKNLIYEAHPFLKERKQVKRIAVIVFASDKGLCGNFNSNILNSLSAFIQKQSSQDLIAIPVGKKADIILRKLNIKALGPAIASSLKAKDYMQSGAEIAQNIARMYLEKEIDQAVIIYNKFKLHFLGKAEIINLLPIRLEGFKIKRVRDYIYEPDAYSLWEELLKEYLVNQIGQVILESNTSEEMARMLAMKQASDNANEVIEKLTLKYHKARQTNITRELIEVASAANV